MSGMAKPGVQGSPKTFDDAKLAQMIEPLKVRIERVLLNGKRTPIPVWENASGEVGGAGFTKAEIAQLEQHLLLMWSGGGLYEVTVTDSSEQPMKMVWYPYWDPNLHPVAVPPPERGAVSPEAVFTLPPQNPQPPLQGPYRMPPFPPSQFYPQQTAGYPMPPPPMVGSPHYANWRDEAERQEAKAEAKRLREENERRDRAATEERHKAELERERAANNERFSRLENMFAGLTNSIKEANATPKGPSPELLAMQAQMAELKEQARKAEERAESARREQEADRRENTLREQMRQQSEDAKRAYEATQRQIETMNQQFQTMIANLTTQMANAGNKHDPLLALMQEQARQNAETIREIAREGRTQMEQFKAFMMNPKDLLSMARESAEGVEKAIERTTRYTDNVVTMQQRVLENAMNMQPQGSGVIDVVREGVTSIKEFAERWVKGKSQEAITAAQAQADIMRSQAHAMEVQARMANPAAFTPPPGLAAPAPAPEPPQPQPPQAIPQPPIEPDRLWGRTDREWFGPLLDDVKQLRAGVQEFLEACEKIQSGLLKIERQEDIPGASPSDAAQGITLAAAMVQAKGVAVPAMTELLIPGHLAEFVVALLPDATNEYREGVVQLLKNPASLQEDEGGDDDDDEDEKAEEVKPPMKTKGARNGKAARA